MLIIHTDEYINIILFTNHVQMQLALLLKCTTYPKTTSKAYSITSIYNS